MAVGALTVLTTVTPFTTWLAHALAGYFESPSGRLLIVLAGAPPQDGVLSQNSHLRCLYAVRAWRAGHFQKVWVSGQGAGAMRDFLATQGIPATAIDTDEASRSTHDSAMRAITVVEASHPAVLLTSDYHMYRSRRAFQHAGAPVAAMPVPDGYKRSTEWYLRWTVLIEEVVEFAKIADYRFKGWI